MSTTASDQLELLFQKMNHADPFQSQLHSNYPLFYLTPNANGELSGCWLDRSQVDSFLLTHSLLQYHIATGLPIFKKNEIQTTD
jgi:hypothetical protein